MSYNFEGWMGFSAEAGQGKMEWGAFEPKVWKEDDVDIKVTHSGVCATDLHILSCSWGNTRYPCCVGHEIVGNVVRVGSDVKHLKVGDRVAVGPQARSCQEASCQECSSGNQNYCANTTQTYNDTFPDGEGNSYGGFSNYHRTKGSFVFKIPEGLASEAAAPMLCAGITVYSPLKNKGCGPGKTVGVVGIGGLGHFAILFAKALGADKVVAISRSSAKKDDALALGADQFIATQEDPEWASKNDRTLDILVSTAAGGNAPVDEYLQVLKPKATFVHLGVPDGVKHPEFNTMSLIFKGIDISGSLIGPPSEINEMLDLAAKKGIKPWIQTMPITEANQAIRDIANGKPRYRLVLVGQA